MDRNFSDSKGSSGMQSNKCNKQFTLYSYLLQAWVPPVSKKKEASQGIEGLRVHPRSPEDKGVMD